MPNTNCLEGMRCPKCGQEDRLKIEVPLMCEVTDNGSEVIDGDHFWNESSFCHCPECDHEGKLCDFRIESQPKREEDDAEK